MLPADLLWRAQRGVRNLLLPGHQRASASRTLHLMETLSLQTLAAFISSSFIFYGEALEERESEGGWHIPPPPGLLEIKGCSWRGRSFWSSMDGVRKSLPALGFTVGMAAPFPGNHSCLGARRGGRGGGGREQRGRERPRSSMGRKGKGKGIFFLCT